MIGLGEPIWLSLVGPDVEIRIKIDCQRLWFGFLGCCFMAQFCRTWSGQGPSVRAVWGHTLETQC